jgi:hypothetical protein
MFLAPPSPVNVTVQRQSRDFSGTFAASITVFWSSAITLTASLIVGYASIRGIDSIVTNSPLNCHNHQRLIRQEKGKMKGANRGSEKKKEE